jgi:hypothetical protein
MLVFKGVTMQRKESANIASCPGRDSQIGKLGVQRFENGWIRVEFWDALVRRPLIQALHG